MCDFLRPFPLEVVQKVAFSPAELTSKDVIAILEPHYCADWEGSDKEKEECIQKQKNFYEMSYVESLNSERVIQVHKRSQ